MAGSAAFEWLGRTGDFVRTCRGTFRFVIALVAGLVSALSFAPFGIFPALLLGVAALVLLVDSACAERHPVAAAALAGWAFGFGQFLAGLYWVGYAFLVDAADHAWQIPLVEFFLPGGIALFIAAACAVAAFFWRRGIARIFLLTFCYAGAEWLRGHVLTGFPWNLPAYGWAGSLAVLQSAAFLGAYGLSLLTIGFGASLALLFDRSRNWALPAAMTVLFVIFWIGGDVRLALTPTVAVPNVHLRLVQPNVPQAEKYLPQDRLRNWRRLIDLSLSKGQHTPTHIVWPEAAPPFLLARSPQALADIARLTGRNKVLLTGAARVQLNGPHDYRFFNSFYVFGAGGKLLDTYDKSHLVPFGEYLPLKNVLKAFGLAKLVDSPGDFTAGAGPRTFAIPGAPPIRPLICYEIIFPDEIAAGARPGWIVNVTDDSWFGPPSSTGPRQHLLTARVRAIERGLPVVRDANTGISAIIDPLGRVTASLASGRMGVIDSPLPAAIAPTFFSRFGEWIFLALMLLCVGAFLAFRDGHRVAYHSSQL